MINEGLLEAVIIPYGEGRFTREIGPVLYDGSRIKIEDVRVFSKKKLSEISEILRLNGGRKVEVHYLANHEEYELPVAVLFISYSMGRG